MLKKKNNSKSLLLSFYKAGKILFTKTGAYIQSPGFKTIVPVYLIRCVDENGNEYFVIDYPHGHKQYSKCQTQTEDIPKNKTKQEK